MGEAARPPVAEQEELLHGGEGVQRSRRHLAAVLRRVHALHAVLSGLCPKCNTLSLVSVCIYCRLKQKHT